MSRFLTLDINGWFDHLAVGGENASPVKRALGFRSCLFKHETRWLFGAAALAAAREVRSGARLIDAIDALAYAAGHGDRSEDDREAFPAALWQLVEDFSSDNAEPTHLALVIPDGRYLGVPRFVGKTGRTRLETLYDALVEARPRALAKSRVELVWRSVAALKATMMQDQNALLEQPGLVFVISVNRRTFWSVLELRHWPPGVEWGRSAPNGGALCILRKPNSDDCAPDEAWTAKRLECVERALSSSMEKEDLDALRQWTRAMEMQASGMSHGSLVGLGVNPKALDHKSWPTPEGYWRVLGGTPPVNWPSATLPAKLRVRLEAFADQKADPPLAVVVESPNNVELTLQLKKAIRKCAPGLPIVDVTGSQLAVAANSLAHALGRDPNSPAWLDEVPRIELEVRREAGGGGGTDWMPIIEKGKAIPAGETFHSPLDRRNRAVSLAPGVEHVHLHLRRADGAKKEDERYSGRDTGHSILPSDHERVVEPVARVRPLSGEARIEIVEHLPDGQTVPLAGSRTSTKWSEMSSEAPTELTSIPELYVFGANQDAWTDLKPLLQEVVARGQGEVDNDLKSKIYKCTQNQWQHQVFPLGSDGLPAPMTDPREFEASKKFLNQATNILHEDLTQAICSDSNLKPAVANRLHMPLTWLFTGCPQQTVKILLEVLLNPASKAARILHLDNEYSAWAIYSGIGRAVQQEDQLRIIFDELVGSWEDSGGTKQDKFLLAAVTHPLARRVSARRVLGENRQRFDRVSGFLQRQLRNLVERRSDPRPGGRSNRSLELRYVTMGLRGLCQLRYQHADWFPVDGAEAQEAHPALIQAQKIGRPFEQDLVERTAPYLIGEGEDPTMPGGF